MTRIQYQIHGYPGADGHIYVNIDQMAIIGRQYAAEMHDIKDSEILAGFADGLEAARLKGKSQ